MNFWNKHLNTRLTDFTSNSRNNQNGKDTVRATRLINSSAKLQDQRVSWSAC